MCLGLVAAVAVTYGRVLDCGFVNYDDPEYVTENIRLQQGLTPGNVVWAFRFTFGNWAPVDTLSHMADVQVFGLNPRGHHATNLVLHALNAMLLFLLLRTLTGASWPSVCAAALFALHPINAGAVAWVSCRKDLLSTFLVLLAAMAYTRYVRAGDARKGARASWYVVTLLVYVMALMAKPMVMTFPVLLLLFDYWPLKRVAAGSRGNVVIALLVEKIPLFVLSVVFAAIAFVSQQAAGSIMSPEWYPLHLRATNAAVSGVLYLWKLIWPFGFTPFYPHPGAGLPAWEIIGSVALLAGITVAAVIFRAAHGYGITGWFWYLVALFPVSGLVVQLGASGMADRYGYVSLIGVYIIAAWGIAELAARHPFGKPIATAAVIAVLGFLAFRAAGETGYWRDSETLWTHAIDVTHDNAIAHSSLGELYLRDGRQERAAGHLAEAIRISPQSYLAQNNYGVLMAMRGDIEGAAGLFEEALRAKPDYAMALCNLAKCRAEEQRYDEALELFQRALKLFREDDANRPVVERAIMEIQALQHAR